MATQGDVGSWTGHYSRGENLIQGTVLFNKLECRKKKKLVVGGALDYKKPELGKPKQSTQVCDG